MKKLMREISYVKNFKLLSSCVVNSKSFAHTHTEDVIYEIIRTCTFCKIYSKNSPQLTCAEVQSH